MSRSHLAALGIVPVVNAEGAYTRLGGSRLAPGVADAMAEAAGAFVPLEQLARSVLDRLQAALAHPRPSRG